MQRKWKRRWQRLTKAILPPVAAGLLFLSAYSPALANPAAGTVVSGSAAISSSGSTMTVNQTTNKAVINWQSFSIGKGETVNFVQPNASAVALNRVIGSDASSIYGSLNANGKVYLINPNGILFAPGSSVNVGGLVASTLHLSDSDFLNGNYTLQKNGSVGSVVNQGTITAANEAVLIGPKVSNDGVIAAKVTGLAAGNKVSLDFSGDNLLGVTVDTGAAGGSVTNTGTITATGGLVVMSAGTKDALLNTVVNNNGVIRAQTVTNAGGVIRLEGNTVTNSGTLDASGKTAGQTGGTVKLLGDTVTLKTGSTIDVSGDAGGGTALIGGAYQGGGSEYAATNTTVESGAAINADALTSGDGGKVVVWAKDTTNFAGAITARGGSVSGDGGSVETSGKKTLVYQGHTDTTAVNGKTGSLLLDPGEYTISTGATSGNVKNVTELINELGSSNITLATDGTGTGDITVSALVSWSSANTLTLMAHNNINLNSAITAANGGLTLAANISGNGGGIITPAAGSSINVGTFTLQSGTWQEVSSNLSSFYAKDFCISGGTFLRATSGDGTGASPYAIADVYGLQGIGSDGMLGKSYTLANNIDASGTQYWNYDGSAASAGFAPIGTYASAFNGSFDGSGHTISGLIINRPGANYVGLFGCSSSGTIRNVGLVGGSIAGGTSVGGLVGRTLGGSSITNSYSTGAVTGTGIAIGGLVGDNSGSITNSYSTGAVTGPYIVGGLAGSNSGSITNSYSTGAVNGGSVGSYVGGLLGENYGIVTNSYWDTATSGQTTGIGGGGTLTGATGLTTDQAFTQSSYTGFDFTNTGAWYMIDGSNRPFLRSEYSTTVTNAHQLQLMAIDLSASYTLANNIDMSELTNDSGLWRTSTTAAAADGSYGFAPIGNGGSPFGSSFDGGGHTISGLIINRPGTDNVGLFGCSSGIISNVGLIGGTITGRNYTGGLAGKSFGTITTSYSTGAVTGHDSVGGLVGSNSGSITTSYSTGAVTGHDSVAGLVGYNFGTGSITNSYSTGAVSGVDYVGGLTGSNDGSITTSYNTGAVTGTGIATGGLVGVNSGSGSITTSYSTGAVDGQDSVGGLVGSNYRSITSSYSTGVVTGTGIATGGLVGSNNGSITTSYSTGAVIGIDDVGGLVGSNYGVITTSYSTGAVSGLSAGGLVGFNANAITDSFWDMDTSGRATGIGAGAMTNGATGLKTADWLTGGPIATGLWNTPNIWAAGYPYPVLKSLPYVLVSASGTQVYGATTKTVGSVTANDQNGNPAGGLIDTSSAHWLTTADSSSSVGSGYVMGATGGSVSPGYQLTYTGTLTVNPATLTITAEGASKTYGQTTALSGYSVSGLVNSDSVSSVTLTSTGTGATANKGTYSITAGNASGTGLGNYNISYANGMLTVNPATLTITASDASKTYGQTAALSGYSVSGLLNSDSVSGVTLTSTGTGATANTGTYAITGNNVIGTGLSNYTITYAGTLTVNPATLTITASDASKTYGQTTTLSGYSVSGLLNSDSVSSVNLTSSGSAATASTGSYAITGSSANGAGLGNYIISYVNGTLTVNPAHLTVTANNATKYTGQANPAFTASYSGLANGDSPAALTGALTFGTPATTASGPGTYTITLTGTLSSPNYTISYVNGVLTVSGQASNPAYDGAVIHADHVAAGLLEPFRGYGRPHGLGTASGYLTNSSGGAALLTIIGTGINTGGYLIMSDGEQ